MQVSWANASLMDTIRGATEPYDARATGCFSIEGPDIAQFLADDLPVQKHQGVKRLILSSRCDFSFTGQMSQEPPHLGRVHVPGVPFIVKQNIPTHPLPIRILRAQGKLSITGHLMHLFAQASFRIGREATRTGCSV